jgi:hypothetical protein
MADPRFYKHGRVKGGLTVLSGALTCKESHEHETTTRRSGSREEIGRATWPWNVHALNTPLEKPGGRSLILRTILARGLSTVSR